MSQYTDDYLEARTETGVSEGFLRGSRRLEKRWELTDGSLPASKVLSSGIDGFNSVSEFLGARKKETFKYTIDSTVGNSEIEKILGATTTDDVDYVVAQVNNLSMLNTYDTFLGIYMSPNGAFTDINYRLGKVAKTLFRFYRII